MISGANENELELSNARADILLMCGSETLKVIDKYYKKQLEAYENMRKKVIDKLNNWNEEKSLAIDDYYLKEDLLNILNKVGGSDE